MTVLERNSREAVGLIEQLNAFSNSIENAADDIAATLSSNGGSAAETGHLTAELVGRYEKER